jgi:hypothetical protein
VDNAIEALQRRDLDAATKAVEAFGSLEPMELTAELFLRLDEVTAAANRDIATIAEILGDDFGHLLAGLLALIAALEDANS